MNDTPAAATAAAPAPRANRRGHPCPSWCQADHAYRDGLLAAHAANAGDIAIGDTSRYDADRVYLHLIHVTGAGPAVNIRGYRHGDHEHDPSASVPPDIAEGLAGVIEMLAAATPGQHRELAAAIRAAAAVITAAEDPDAPVRE